MNKNISLEETPPMNKFFKDFGIVLIVFILICSIQGWDTALVSSMFYNSPLIYSASYAITIPLFITVIINLVAGKNTYGWINTIYEACYEVSYVMLAILSTLLLVSLWVEPTKTLQILLFLILALLLATLSHFCFKRRIDGKNDNQKFLCKLSSFIISVIIMFIAMVVFYILLVNALELQSCVIQFKDNSIVCNIFERFPLLKSIQDNSIGAWKTITDYF